jgi:hypothetical protein
MEQRCLSEIVGVAFLVGRMAHVTIHHIEAIRPLPTIEFDGREDLGLVGINAADLHVRTTDIRLCRS